MTNRLLALWLFILVAASFAAGMLLATPPLTP